MKKILFIALVFLLNCSNNNTFNTEGFYKCNKYKDVYAFVLDDNIWLIHNFSYICYDNHLVSDDEFSGIKIKTYSLSFSNSSYDFPKYIKLQPDSYLGYTLGAIFQQDKLSFGNIQFSKIKDSKTVDSLYNNFVNNIKGSL